MGDAGQDVVGAASASESSNECNGMEPLIDPCVATLGRGIADGLCRSMATSDLE